MADPPSEGEAGGKGDQATPEDGGSLSRAPSDVEQKIPPNPKSFGRVERRPSLIGRDTVEKPTFDPGFAKAAEEKNASPMLEKKELEGEEAILAMKRERQLEALNKAPANRSDNDQRVLEDAVRDTKAFQELSRGDLRDIVRTVHSRKLKGPPGEWEEGEWLWRAGDVGDKFYVILTGSVAVMSAPDPERSGAPEVHIATLHAGESFGEIALVTDACRRSAGILALEACDLLEVARGDYDRILKEHKQRSLERRLDILRGLPVFGDLPLEDLKAISQLMVERQIRPRAVVIREGSEADAIMVIESGEARMVKELPAEAVPSTAALTPESPRTPRAAASGHSEARGRRRSSVGIERGSRGGLVLPDIAPTPRRLTAQSGSVSSRDTVMEGASRTSRMGERRGSLDGASKGAPGRQRRMAGNEEGRASGRDAAGYAQADGGDDEPPAQPTTPRGAPGRASPRLAGIRLAPLGAGGGGEVEETFSHRPGGSPASQVGTPGSSLSSQVAAPSRPVGEGWDGAPRPPRVRRPSLGSSTTRRGSRAGSEHTSTSSLGGPSKSLRAKQQRQFVDMGNVGAGHTFGVGEVVNKTLFSTSLIAETNLNVMILTKWDLLRRLEVNSLEVFALHAIKSQRSDEAIQERLAESLKWEKYKQGLVESMVVAKRT
mmetsp:Transcript_50156/g.160650  ORF Transcript_50156/g.160650 Transcript_50156/m.160650 type:complete len:661 (+) Transcript_50156:270-2252(+)